MKNRRIVIRFLYSWFIGAALSASFLPGLSFAQRDNAKTIEEIIKEFKNVLPGGQDMANSTAVWKAIFPGFYTSDNPTEFTNDLDLYLNPNVVELEGQMWNLIGSYTHDAGFIVNEGIFEICHSLQFLKTDDKVQSVEYVLGCEEDLTTWKYGVEIYDASKNIFVNKGKAKNVYLECRVLNIESSAEFLGCIDRGVNEKLNDPKIAFYFRVPT